MDNLIQRLWVLVPKVAGQMRASTRGRQGHRMRVAGAGSILMLARGQLGGFVTKGSGCETRCSLPLNTEPHHG